ncbi:MAG: RHS repeat-associated core domain-containing protein [Alphaproteobacteria bacterium]|nr:RHS repeat-associated core domain-containing protein [Alphaproteobacteria bacterium]
MSYSSTDIVISGARGSISIVRTYRTMDGNAGAFGIGTNFNYGYQLGTFAYLQGQGVITLATPDGNQFAFNQQTDGTFINTTVPALRGAVLTPNGTSGTYILKWREGTTYQFQTTSFGVREAFLTSITDPNGNTISFTLNPSVAGQITQITDPVGRSFNLVYDSFNRITSITDSTGRAVSYIYNSQGTLATFTDAAGGVTNYSYDSQNNLISITDPRGVVTEQNTYDSNGRVMQQVEADGGVYQFAYSLSNPMVPTSPVLQTVVTDPMGHRTTYRFDPQGFLLNVIDATGQQTALVRDPGHNNLVSAYQGTATCATCGSPAQGNVSYTFDSAGNVLTKTDALGRVTSFTYDTRFNKVASITDPLGNVTAFTYDSAGNLLTSKDPGGNTTNFTYNSFGQVTQITDPLSNATKFSYDAFGNLVSTTDPLGNTTSTVYDALSRPIQTIDALSRKSESAYDALGRVVKQTNAQGNSAQFTYDKVGNVLSVADAKGNKTSFAYDGMSRLLTRTDPLGHSDSRTYDKNGNLIQFVDRRGQKSMFTYDAVNRLIGESYQDGSTVSRAYDANGRLTNATDSASGSFDFTYDAAGHLLSASNPVGSIQYSYDAAGRMNSHQVSGQSALTYTYDKASNLAGASMPQASVGFVYDQDNRLTTITRANGVNSHYVYDAASHLLSITHSGGQGINIPLVYSYDPTGNRTNYSTPVAQPLITQAAGYSVNVDNQLVTGSTSSGPSSYVYDANGNLSSVTNSSGTTTYTWDSRDRLVSISGPGQTASFVYDFKGKLISERSSDPSGSLTQNFLLDDLTNVAYIARSNGDSLSVLSGRILDQHLAVVHSSGQVEYGLSDAVNSTTTTVDQTGRQLASFFYEPFGQTTTTGAYPFQFTGRAPVEDGLYYYRARFYAADAGRFISEDPSGFSGGVNSYSYADNNVPNWTDPRGLDVTVNYYSGQDGNPFGHVGICINGGQCFGFDPGQGGWGFLTPFGIPVPGEVDPIEGNRPIISSETIPTTPEQDQEILGYIHNRQSSPGAYDLYFRNCAQFARSALAAGGISTPWSVLPSSLLSGLQNQCTCNTANAAP